MSGRRFGHRLCIGWVIWYTRRVPWEVAAERRDEIFSDLWEHAADAARRGEGGLRHECSVIRRTLAGAPADLSWRRAARASRPSVALPDGSSLGPARAHASKRWICRIVGHRERRFPYPGSGDPGHSGHYLLCLRCGRVHADDKSGDSAAQVNMGSM
jgi:hypothetical protein